MGLTNLLFLATLGATAVPRGAALHGVDYRKLANRIYDARLRGERRSLAKRGGWRPERLPAIEALAAADRSLRPFDGYQPFGLVHLEATTEALIGLLEQAGARRDGHFQGKSYSEHPLVIEELQRRGRIAGDHAWGKHPHVDQRAAARQLVVELKAEAARDPSRRFLVFDDGGHLIEALDDAAAHDPALARRIAAVQQTRSGTERLRPRSLHFPVVDLGDAWVKRVYESPSIGRSVALSSDRALRELGKARHPIVLLGYGAVGRATARALRALGYPVRVFDRDPARMTLAARDGLHGFSSLADALRAGDVLLGTTGEVVVDPSNAHLVPRGAILINGASFDSEFDLLALHGRDTVHVKRGQPVNFGTLRPIPARYIQLTRGLLYEAGKRAVALLAAGARGQVSLEDHVQLRVLDAVSADLARTGETLLEPRFSDDE